MDTGAKSTESHSGCISNIPLYGSIPIDFEACLSYSFGFQIITTWLGRRGKMGKFNRVFIHGLESSSQGNKARYFREKYPDMLIEDYRGPLDRRMAKLEKLLAGKQDLIIVGSSYGGLMAAMYTCRHPEDVRKLVLLAPALDLDDFTPFQSRNLDVATTIFHGRNDDVVPLNPVRDIARRVFTNLSFNILEDDHPLSATFETLDWDDLLLEKTL